MAYFGPIFKLWLDQFVRDMTEIHRNSRISDISLWTGKIAKPNSKSLVYPSWLGPTKYNTNLHLFFLDKSTYAANNSNGDGCFKEYI